MSVHEQHVERDLMREKLFKDAYGLDVKISYTAYNDSEWNWDKAVLKFVDSLGKTYGLIEHFPQGADNSTDFVIFEYFDKKGDVHQDRFDKSNTKTGEIFLAAELAMAELMIKRRKGEDT